MTEDDESYNSDGGHPSWGTDCPQHVNPGMDATINPVFVPDTYREKPGKKEEPMYLISESELDQIKNDCLYPERQTCDGCECADGIDDTRASGLGCNFKGANALMDEVIARGSVAQQAQSDLFTRETPASITLETARRREKGIISNQKIMVQQTPDCSQCVYERFAANMANAEAHDAREQETDKETIRLNPATTFFLKASDKIEQQYFREIEIRRFLSFDKCTETQFFEEYIYAIMNIGMREQTMRKSYDKFMQSLDINDIKTRFPTKQRAAANEAKEKFVQWFGELVCAKDPVEYLATLPLIGKTTKWHLAQNLGIDCVKPDIHLVRLSKRFGFRSPLEMCEKIRKEIGGAEDLKTIDLILWRYCNLYGSESLRSEVSKK